MTDAAGRSPTPLGLPGLSDLHTHFLPPRVMAKVRAQFDAAGPLIGRPWPLHYRDTDEVLVETLRSFGVRRFTALPYAHKPDMAEFLNDWAAGFAARVPEALVCGTFFPEPGVAAYVAARSVAAPGRGLEGARAGRRLRRHRPAARRGVGDRRRRRHAGRAPRRQRPGRHRAHRPRAGRRAAARATRGCGW